MKNNNTDLKDKMNKLFQVAQSELKKTTQIGMKMFSASQSNSLLHETYEALGIWLIEAVENGKVKVDDVEVEALIARAKELMSTMENFEKEVQEIKKDSN
jgi:hypothetical protein